MTNFDHPPRILFLFCYYVIKLIISQIATVNVNKKPPRFYKFPKIFLLSTYLQLQRL